MFGGSGKLYIICGNIKKKERKIQHKSTYAMHTIDVKQIYLCISIKLQQFNKINDVEVIFLYHL